MKKLYVTLRHNHNLTQLGLGGHYSRLRNARTQDPTIFLGRDLPLLSVFVFGLQFC